GMSSEPGDLVLDAFSGSGTTLAVAQELGRRWIGIDANPGAIHTAAHRLGKLVQRRGSAQGTLLDGDHHGTGFDVMRIGNGPTAQPAEARFSARRHGDAVELTIESFTSPDIPDHRGDWRQIVDAVLIDPGYSGGVFRPRHLDVPEKRGALISGRYHLQVPVGTTLAVKIVDVLGNEVLVTQPSL
ncbi:MAG: Type III restriction-modification system methylation subunit, partial [uncultured Gemmatimonadetes bacterium]